MPRPSPNLSSCTHHALQRVISSFSHSLFHCTSTGYISSIDALKRTEAWNASQPYMQTMKSIPTHSSTTCPIPKPASLSAPAATFATSTVPAAAIVGSQLTVPQAYPLGQHPPLALAGHVDHPFAQLPSAAAVVAAEPAGTPIVSPLNVTSCTVEVLGQFVVAQSRPVRQQPPW